MKALRVRVGVDVTAAEFTFALEAGTVDPDGTVVDEPTSLHDDLGWDQVDEVDS